MKEVLLRLTLIFGVVLVPLTSVWEQAFAQNTMGLPGSCGPIYTEEIRSQLAKRIGIFSIANTFFVMMGAQILLWLALGRSNVGIKVVPEVQNDALNVAFDQKSGSLFVFQRGKSELVKIKADGKGLPDLSTSPSRSALRTLGIKNAQVLAFDSDNGRLFILDAGIRRSYPWIQILHWALTQLRLSVQTKFNEYR
jgi:hypothetical protein